MNQLLSIVDDKIVIEKLRLKHLEGNVLHSGNLTVVGAAAFNDSVTLDKDLKVKGAIEVETLKVANLITDNAEQKDAFTFEAHSLNQLDGKGLLWHEPTMTHQFVLRDEPRRIWTTENIDLHRDAKFQIGGADVVLADRLGNAIVHSNLKTVGVLESLSVRGDVDLGDSIFINSSLGRLGLNTDQPNGALSVVDNLVEVIIGAYKDDQAYIGTWSNNTLNIGTDNTSRIAIQGNAISFGSSKYKNADVKIHGQLEVNKLLVNELVADTRIERSTPIEFKATADNSIFGKGLLWTGDGPNRQFILLPNPDRLHSTESINLVAGKEFLINNTPVLRETGLGESVVYSSLTSLGTLQALTVSGPINLSEQLIINDGTVSFSNTVNVGSLTISERNIKAAVSEFNLAVEDTTELSISSTGNIQLGSKENTTRVVSVYGRLAVNVSNPSTDANFTVDGSVVINGKKQTHGDQIPAGGNWNKGDIIWNNDPQETSYIGWVCVMSGTPGTWKPFGYIGER